MRKSRISNPIKRMQREKRIYAISARSPLITKWRKCNTKPIARYTEVDCLEIKIELVYRRDGAAAVTRCWNDKLNSVALKNEIKNRL